MAFPFFTEDEQPTMANFNEKFQALLQASGKVEAGSYIGTDRPASNLNIKTISLPFRPKFIVILSNIITFSSTGTTKYLSLYFGVENYGYELYGDQNNPLDCSFFDVTISNNSISFKNKTSNIQGINYKYVAIG